MHDGDAGAAGRPVGRPLRLEDVDRVLDDTDTLPASPDARRVCRDDLSQLLEVLGAAVEILAVDVALLRRCLGAPGGLAGSGDLAGDLAGILATRTWGPGWSTPRAPVPAGEPDPGVLIRAVSLGSAHHDVARTDLSSPVEVARTLEGVERQLAALTERHTAVQARLAEVRAAIVDEWSAHVTRSLDTPA